LLGFDDVLMMIMSGLIADISSDANLSAAQNITQKLNAIIISAPYILTISLISTLERQTINLPSSLTREPFYNIFLHRIPTIEDDYMYKHSAKPYPA